MKFPGFSLGLLHFLSDLAKHNNREWFQDNKERYETELREPALAFVASMAAQLAKLSPHFRAEPKKVGGSLMRIHRDMRFSKDKRPYKTNVGIQFRHNTGRDVHCPGFYFHIDLEDVFLGVGIWHPGSDTLKFIRRSIDRDPDLWKKATGGKAFRNRYSLAGDSLKRPPKGYETEHPWIDDLKRKDFIAIQHLDHDALFEPNLVNKTIANYRAAKPLMEFLCRAVGVKC